MAVIIKRIRRAVINRARFKLGLSNREILEHYVSTEPTPQAAIDIFRDEWSSHFPPPLSELQAGDIELFDDPRVRWALSQFGEVKGKSILELGPLEGGHSYMLERAEFGCVLGIEANTRAYLKCLISKELLGLSRTHFVCGDFTKYLQASPPHFDAVFACGVLYHMTNPAELIELISRAADQVFIWTHYHDSSSRHARRFSEPKITEQSGFSHIVYRQYYGSGLGWRGSCGGPRRYSHWMRRDDILACLSFFGFSDIRTSFENPDHENGPAFALVAKKKTQQP